MQRFEYEEFRFKNDLTIVIDYPIKLRGRILFIPDLARSSSGAIKRSNLACFHHKA